MWEKFVHLLGTICKTIVWTTWNAVFGLAPIIAIYFVKTFYPDNRLITNTFLTSKILEDGIVFFLATALMAEVCIDFILLKKGLHLYFVVLLLVFTGSMLVGAVTIFCELFFHPNNNYSQNALLWWQNFFIFVSSAFCLVFKTLLFYKE